MGALIANDAAAFLADFGESVMYTPHNGTPKAVTALVYRDVPSRVAEASGGLHSDIEIMIANDATLGVTAIHLGKDKVTLARRMGLGAEAFTVTQILSQDEGIWHLQLR